MLRREELKNLLNLLKGRSEALFKSMKCLEKVNEAISVEVKDKFLSHLDNLTCAVTSIELVLGNEGDVIPKVKREKLAKNLLIVFEQDYKALLDLGEKVERESELLLETEGQISYSDVKKINEELKKLKTKYESHKIVLLEEYKYMNEIFIELKSEDHSFDEFRVKLNNMAKEIFTFAELE